MMDRSEEIYNKMMERNIILLNAKDFSRVLNLMRAGYSVSEIALATGNSEDYIRSTINIIRRNIKTK